MKKRLLLSMLAFVTCLVGFTAWAGNFTVTNSGNKFTIKRSDATVKVTVKYRTVSLSALAGVHFIAVADEVTFNVGDTAKSVTVTEKSVATLEYPYRYQSSTSRTYRFEVLDKSGFRLAYKNRAIDYGDDYKVSNSYLNKSVSDLVYFSALGSIGSGAGNKFLDVSYESSDWIQVTDAGYNQGVHVMKTSSLFNDNSGLRTYLNSLGYRMYATVYFTQKEEQDGYQYIQILADTPNYDGNDPNGAVNDPSVSLYKACFILSYEPSGSVMSDAHHQFFPHRYDYVDKAAEIAAGLNYYEFDYDNSHLYQQKYKSSAYDAPNTGSLNLSPTVNNIVVRFDAAGSGGDTWDFMDLKARLALVDATAPTLLGTPVPSAGPYNEGNTFTVSVPFNEIMTVSGTPTLTTSWGTMNYISGAGSNVLTFQGTIDAPNGTPLSITGYSGTIRDYVGNNFTGTITATFSDITARGRYNYDSATGVLSLICGEFSTDNKWGSEVVPSAVTSVTATDEVKFTGDCSRLFYNFNCQSMDLGNVNTVDVTDMSFMFNNCSNLTSLNITGWNTVNVTDMSSMFSGCSNLTSLNISGWNTSSVTKMRFMFSFCTSLTSLDLTGWNTANVTDMCSMFSNCSSFTSIDVSNFNTANVTDMCSMFYGCHGLTSLNVSNFNTANVSKMSSMFDNCEHLTSLDVSNFDTSNVTDMGFMFSNCQSLTSLNLSEWNTANVTDMCSMFYGCHGLTSLDLSGWNTANVTKMNYTFSNCYGLTSLDLSGWNTAKVTRMVSLFQNCQGLTSLYLSGWNLANVTDMSSMFRGCTSLTSLDLSGWNTANVADMNNIFNQCTKLSTIYAGAEWSTESVTNSIGMFNNCRVLAGGMGTTYDVNHTDGEYARIDRGADEPGYLTGLFALTLPENVTATPAATLTHDSTAYYAAGDTITLGYNGNVPENYKVAYTVTIDGSDPAETVEVIDGTFVMPDADVTVSADFILDGILIDEENFPDANFRNYLLSQDYGSDSILTFTEIAGITYIDVAMKDVSDMTGIEHFTALTRLDCFGNHHLTSLDVSKNTALTQLCCNNNKLTSLDVSHNTALTTLYCNVNQLTALDVSHNTALKFLSCYSNQLTALDVSHNTALETLDCYSNQLAALDVSQNTALTRLECQHNQLAALDVSHNTALRGLYCSGNLLNSLDVSHNTALRALDCSSNQLTALDVSNNTALEYLYCYSNQLTALDVSHNTALTGLSCYNNQLTSLDVSHNTALTYLDCRLNQLTALDVSHNTALVELYCSENQIYGGNMEALVASLPTVDVDNNDGENGWFGVINLDPGADQNVITTTQVTTARGKNWTVYGLKNGDWEEYDGSEPTTTVPGDVNGDGAVTSADVTEIYNYLLSGDETYLDTGDVNGDGSITSADITAIYSILLGN